MISVALDILSIYSWYHLPIFKQFDQFEEILFTSLLLIFFFSKIHNSKGIESRTFWFAPKRLDLSKLSFYVFWFYYPKQFPNGHLLKFKYVVKNSIFGGLKVAVWKLLKGNSKKTCRKIVWIFLNIVAQTRTFQT